MVSKRTISLEPYPDWSRLLEFAKGEGWNRIANRRDFRNMIQLPPPQPTRQGQNVFASVMSRLGETFAVRDLMVPIEDIKYVESGNEDGAKDLVTSKRYSVVPISNDGQTFKSVYATTFGSTGERIVGGCRDVVISDHIPDSTPIAEAFFLFDDREWYLTLRANRVSGLLTYWAFNGREFRVQLYAGFSRVEELARDVLAADNCGVADGAGLGLEQKDLKTALKRFKDARLKMGSHRFLDELLFSQLSKSLRQHARWRNFLNSRIGRQLSDDDYPVDSTFTEMRNAVMHGRLLFSTYQDFKAGRNTIGRVGDLIVHLEAYADHQSSTKKPWHPRASPTYL